MSDEEKWILSLWNAGLIRQRSNWIKGSGTTKQRNWWCVGPKESVSQIQQPLWAGVFFSVHICWKQASAQTVKSDQHNFYCHLKTPLMLPKVILEARLHFRGLSSLPKAPGCVFSRLHFFLLFIIFQLLYDPEALKRTLIFQRKELQFLFLCLSQRAFQMAIYNRNRVNAILQFPMAPEKWTTVVLF